MIKFPVIATDQIRVVVRNSIDGQSRITEIEAFHLNDLPQPRITVARARGRTNSTIDFRIAAFDRDGKIQHYELDFGDDSSTYEWHFDHQKPADKPRLTHRHVYEKEGTYEVKLRVVDDSNEASETTMRIIITDPPRRNTSRVSQKVSNRGRQ